jgi:hypothetical protein
MPTKKTNAATRLAHQIGRRAMPKKTDVLRRLAMQIAVQLPESVTEAHTVLELARDLLDKFMIDGRKAARRK